MTSAVSDFARQLEELDPALFSIVPSQSTINDRRSLLALHLAARETHGSFSYLEIGSHLGGSLQAVVADQACASITSIDPRPKIFPDERGVDCDYIDNSTVRMMEHLAKVPGANLEKIRTIEADAKSIDPSSIIPRPHFCFVDGEHTNTASLSDAQFCLKVVQQNGCIAFHDANIVYGGIERFLRELENLSHPFKAYLLPDTVFVVELGDGLLIRHPKVLELYMESWKGYMFGMKSSEWYRSVLNKPLFRLLRQTRFVRRLFIVPE